MSLKQLVKISELAPKEIREVVIEGRQRLLVVGEKGPALIDQICPHAGGNLSAGTVIGHRIRCPTHGYLFDLNTGSCPLGRREGWDPLPVYPLIESQGYLCVQLGQSETA